MPITPEPCSSRKPATRPTTRKSSPSASGSFWSSLRGPQLSAIAVDELHRIRPDVAEADFLLDLFAANGTAIQGVRQKRVEIGFLVTVGVARVVGQHHPDDRHGKPHQAAPLLEREVDRQAALPR